MSFDEKLAEGSAKAPGSSETVDFRASIVLATARKDLRSELRAGVFVSQILPFALLVLILFAFALDPDRGVLRRVSPGLIWVTVLFSALLAARRSRGIETESGAEDVLSLLAVDFKGVFVGKVLAMWIELCVLVAALLVGAVVFYEADFSGFWLLGVSGLLASAGLAACSVVYSVLAGGVRGGESLLPVLLLPVAVPILLGATRSWEAGIGGYQGEGWASVLLLGIFALINWVAGAYAYAALVEES